MSQKHTKSYFVVSLFVAGLFVFGMIYSSKSYASSINRDYSSDVEFTVGQAVSYDQSNSDKIVPANLENSEYFAGIIQNTQDASIALTTQFSETSVAVDGRVYALVSDINGIVENGDLLSLSAFDGVLKKHSKESNDLVVGIALQGFEGQPSSLFSDVSFSDGSTKDIQVGYINVQLSDVRVGAAISGDSSSGFFSSIVGKNISNTRTFVAAGVFLLSVSAAALYTFSTIRGSFISLGRNPLASDSILTGVVQVSAISSFVLMVGATVTYVVLVV